MYLQGYVLSCYIVINYITLQSDDKIWLPYWSLRLASSYLVSSHIVKSIWICHCFHQHSSRSTDWISSCFWQCLGLINRDQHNSWEKHYISLVLCGVTIYMHLRCANLCISLYVSTESVLPASLDASLPRLQRVQ